MAAKIGQNGLVIGDDGQPILDANGAEIKVDIEPQITERLRRESEKLNRALAEKDDQIKRLQEQSSRTPGLEQMLVDLRSEKALLEAQVAENTTKLAEAQRSAQEQVATQIAQIKAEADSAKAALVQEQNARLRENLTNQLLSAAGSDFNNASLDVVPHLLANHKREPELGQDGKPVEGKFRDLFEVRVKKADGTESVEALTAPEAVKAWGSMNAHYLRASNANGSGGGSYGSDFAGVKRGGMTAKQKSDFVEKHGQEAYLNLPQ